MARKSKEKRIKDLKKVHILPHFFLLLLFSIFFVVVITAVTEIFFMFLVDNHLRDSYQKVQMLTEAVEVQNDIRNFDISTIPGEFNDFAIYDSEENKYIVKAKQELNLERTVKFEFNDDEVYFDRVDSTGKISVGDDDGIDIAKLVSETVKRSDLGFNIDSEKMNEDAYSFHAWIDEPVKGGTYHVYYSTDVVLKVRDVIYIIIFVVIMVILAMVPMLLYIITLILSLVRHKRTTKLIFYDAVTGGNNWLYFVEKARRLIGKNKRGKHQYAMVCLRMERYQGYCACYGAMEGEALIERINQAISKSVKKRKELFARYAEAEFGLMLLMENPKQVADRMEEIRTSLINMVLPRKIDFSVGLCEVPVKGQVDELYGNASLARKSIPVNASEKICWFNEKLKEEQQWERFVEENMEKALNNGELHVYLQPKYGAGTKRLGGAEALIRWISPTEGFIGPGKFIPIFEKNGFITKIDDFMLSSVAKLQAKWVAEDKNVVPISVNISRAHFTQEDLAEHICRIVDEAGAPKELIELELTESAFFEDKDILINTVEKLKDMGFSVSMDDFGAGYSSLNSLKDLQLDVLKIDADFFRGREKNEERGSLIVEETIHLAKNLGMTTVAEGIESADQVEFLAKSGCDLIQGFYFAKPMPIEDYEKKMEEDKAAGEN